MALIAQNILKAIVIGVVAVGLATAVTDITPLQVEDWRWRYALRWVILLVAVVLQLRVTPSEKGFLRYIHTMIIVGTILLSIGHALDLVEGERMVDGAPYLFNTKQPLE